MAQGNVYVWVVELLENFLLIFRVSEVKVSIDSMLTKAHNEFCPL